MTQGIFIAGDWGTTRLRLALCDGATIIDRKTGPGIAVLTDPVDLAFLSLTEEWRAAHGPLPAFLCGMVGSRNGWREAPYASCPADPRSLRAAALSFTAGGCRISIGPGLTCTNPLGAPDVMRGEETQILGALLGHPDLARGRHLIALPGTHTKWVALENGTVTRFMTVPTGELYALLRTHSTLTKAGPPPTGDTVLDSLPGFRAGLSRRHEVRAQADLLATLFEVRTRQLIDKMPPDDAIGFLSGLLIGADVDSALRGFGKPDQVHLIGEPALAQLYAMALMEENVASSVLDGNDCAFAGLRSIFADPAMV